MICESLLQFPQLKSVLNSLHSAADSLASPCINQLFVDPLNAGKRLILYVLAAGAVLSPGDFAGEWWSLLLLLLLLLLLPSWPLCDRSMCTPNASATASTTTSSTDKMDVPPDAMLVHRRRKKRRPKEAGAEDFKRAG